MKLLTKALEMKLLANGRNRDLNFSTDLAMSKFVDAAIKAGRIVDNL
jgi:hypothetical protein